MSTSRMSIQPKDLKCHRKRRFLIKALKPVPYVSAAFFFCWVLWLLQPVKGSAKPDLPCLKSLSSVEALLVADFDGRILYKKNERQPCIPASTLKILTSLVSIHNLGASYRFPTEFYMDDDENLKVRGLGDPLLVSEVWQDIADALSRKIPEFKDLVLDDTYFSRDILIPGRKHSTNPYDAPVGALCANFNTVFFHRDRHGSIQSSEAQTPLTPLARKRIKMLDLKRGRYTFSHDQREATRYAGEILSHFLQEKGVKMRGKIRLDAVKPNDTLKYTYRSRFTLEEALQKMLKFSNNFIANQIIISMGACTHGPPGTLAKGVEVVSDFARRTLQLGDIEIVEGSGISRENRLSALDMLTILEQFKPYRHLLTNNNKVSYKTGSLRGIRTRAGYMEGSSEKSFYFVIFLNRGAPAMESTMRCITQALARRVD